MPSTTSPPSSAARRATTSTCSWRRRACCWATRSFTATAPGSSLLHLHDLAEDFVDHVGDSRRQALHVAPGVAADLLLLVPDQVEEAREGLVGRPCAQALGGDGL